VGQTFLSAGENVALKADRNVCPTDNAERGGLYRKKGGGERGIGDEDVLPPDVGRK
jgi:hypothetical protein